MVFAGLKKKGDRKNLIAFIESLQQLQKTTEKLHLLFGSSDPPNLLLFALQTLLQHTPPIYNQNYKLLKTVPVIRISSGSLAHQVTLNQASIYLLQDVLELPVARNKCLKSPKSSALFASTNRSFFLMESVGEYRQTGCQSQTGALQDSIFVFYRSHSRFVVAVLRVSHRHKERLFIRRTKAPVIFTFSSLISNQIILKEIFLRKNELFIR